MKILFITDLYPIEPDKEPSVRTLHNFVFNWIKQGNEVDVIRPNFLINSFLRGKSFFKRGFYEFEGIRIFNVNYHTPFLFDIEKKLPKELDISSYDVIVAHMPSGIIFANKFAKKYNKPLVCGVHCSDLEVLKKPLYKFYFRSQMKDAYERAKKIACRSFVLQKKLVEMFPQFKEKTFVVASGVDNISSPLEGEDKGGGQISFTSHLSPFTILTCANLIKRKNIDKLIQAVNQLEDIELSVIGDGGEFENLKRIASSKIKFLGRLSQDKVFEEMQKNEIFILPSVNETLGMVYLEAMASGCIVVCAENDGIDGIITDGKNGFLTQPTVEGIKETISRIKNYPNLEEIRKNSLETIKNYTPELCAKNYLDNLK